MFVAVGGESGSPRRGDMFDGVYVLPLAHTTPDGVGPCADINLQTFNSYGVEVRDLAENVQTPALKGRGRNRARNMGVQMGRSHQVAPFPLPGRRRQSLRDWQPGVLTVGLLPRFPELNC